MTATTALRHRLEHLEHTSLALALAAPSTSAALGAEAQRLRGEVEIAEGTHRHATGSPHCQRCGAILIPGWSSSVALERTQAQAVQSGRSSKRKSAALRVRQTPVGVLAGGQRLKVTCLKCFHQVRRPLLEAGLGLKMRNQNAKSGDSDKLHPSNVSPSPRAGNDPRSDVSPAAGAGSQEDASKKARKRRKGGKVSSLLARTQDQMHLDAKGSDLGLMDFLVPD